jgi:putative aminopeptidase FrvX
MSDMISETILTPRKYECDVCVCGGGVAGIAAALSAKRAGAEYAVDVYPHYGSDVEATLRGGNDIKHGLIGPGVYASHGYERSHVDAVENTLKLMLAYVGAM